MDEAAGVSWSVERVLEMISANARAWRGDGLKIFTELRFLYEEEEYPEEFFVPYVWTLVCSHSTAIRWDKARVLLFAPPSAPAPVVEEEEEEDGGAPGERWRPYGANCNTVFKIINNIGGRF
mmetsp:Transcript_50136/g.160567  ORF Transcript_50136/g.160567 Transcript_50136/m.160567 type:complete len:122 (+) Transcript_50136:1030-1395(+)